MRSMRGSKFLLSGIIGLMLVPQTAVSAAKSSVARYQARYAKLNKRKVDAETLNTEGALSENYRLDQLAYINYYRSLFKLPPVKLKATDNRAAQTTAEVMAAICANPFVNQHGLPNRKRPQKISRANWKLAKEVSYISNLDFTSGEASAGDIITDMVTDKYNLTGADTGHRAWLLSPKLTTVGLGAAYGKNDYRYSVIKVINGNDYYRRVKVKTVLYPSSCFPVQLAKGRNIYWSIYLVNKRIKKLPTIYIYDLTTRKKYKASRVSNHSRSWYGYFRTIITYKPGKTPLKAGHHYKVVAKKLVTYKFVLFDQNPND